VEAAVGTLGALEKAKAEFLKLSQLGWLFRLAYDDDESSRDIVGAVAVVDAGSCEQSVLEDADLVAQPYQMAERG
jgi:hypothetical protein